jgi:hypothetical protein
MSGRLITSVIAEAWDHFGGFPPERHAEIAEWVKVRVSEIRDGKVPMPLVPTEKAVKAFRCWYDTEAE